MTRIIWALFGNDEDGIYGEFPHTWWGAVRWWIRNPCHNLMFHVLNCPAPFRSVGDYPSDVFSPVGGWNRVTRYSFANGKTYRFISYIGRIKFYIGWRERGNFGIKLTANRKL